MNGQDVSWFHTIREVGSGDNIVSQFENDGEGSITRVLQPPFLPAVGPWGGSGISFGEELSESREGKELGPVKGVGS